jgi:Fe-S-cluster-containing hydrogenase component 2
MIGEAKSFVLRECICRKQKALEGQPCSHLMEACLGFSNDENAYDDFVHAGRIIRRDEALKVLEATSKEGLVYCTYNVKQGQRFVCSCCACCCELLRGLKEQKSPYILAGSNFQAAIDIDNCSVCGVCAEERCVMDAISEEDGAYRVMAERCIGCGVCTITCPTGSITLSRRPESDCDDPPANLIEWNTQRGSNRLKATGSC